MNRFRRAAAVPLLFLALACTARSRPPAAADLPGPEVVDLDNRAMLLMLADRRELLRLPLDRAMIGGPGLREELAVTIGHIGDARGRPMLEGLLRDEAVAVRRAAALALGELGDQAAGEKLLAAATDPDRETGALAVEALGKLGASLAELRPRLAALGEPEASARLLPQLFRFREPAALETGLAGLSRPEGPLRAAAAYGIARYPRPEAAPALRSLLADPDPWIRALAARGLGEVGEVGGVGEVADLARLRRLLEESSDAGADAVAIQAMRAGARLRMRADAVSEEEIGPWRQALAARFADKAPGVRITALETAAAFVSNAPFKAASDAALEAALASRFASAETVRERELALLALAGAGSVPAREAERAAALARSPVLRAAAAHAAGRLEDREMLAALSGDSEPRVRLAVLEVRLARKEPEAEARGWARAALEDVDPAVRATALDWWAEHPGLSVEALAAAAAGTASPRAGGLEDDRLSAVRAIKARARSTAVEWEACLAALESLSRDGSYLVRREAVLALRDLGEVAPPLAALETRRDLSAYREILLQTAYPRRVEMTTTRGRLVLELACPQAPMTCLSFLQLARSGFFDGQTLHRVVPDFVVQGGDPRGDGWGGPGYALRDEINRLRFVPGALGMALSGPDTGGSQFFVTLSPQPHLDGGYTVFGRLVEGVEILTKIVQGDEVLGVREIPTAP